MPAIRLRISQRNLIQLLAVRGYADRKLLDPKDPMHFSNRRVSILVAYTAKGQ